MTSPHTHVFRLSKEHVMKRFLCGCVALAAIVGAASQARSAYIYWTETGNATARSGDIRRANVDGTGQQPLVTGLDSPIGIALDLSAGKMYWSESAFFSLPIPGNIRYANLDGSSPKVLLPTGGAPTGLALDGGGRMYWADGGANNIDRANVDGTDRKVLINTPTAVPFALAVDTGGGELFWTAPGNGNGKGSIRQASLDGSNPTTIVTQSSSFGIALDRSDGKIYWTEFNGRVPNGGDIRRANPDGSDPQTLVTGLSGPTGIALDPPTGTMYWTDFNGGDIRSANLDGSSQRTLISGLDHPVEIALEVPEPSALSLLGVAACALVWCRGRVRG